MKKITQITTLLLMTIMLSGLSSCDKQSTIFKEFKDIPDWNWRRVEQPIIAFDFEVEEAGYYDIIVALRHTTIYQYKNLKTTVELIMPSGDKRLLAVDFKIVGDDGMFAGSGLGSLWDLEKPVFENVNLYEAGKYRVEIENVMKTYDVQGLMEVGLIVQTPKEK